MAFTVKPPKKHGRRGKITDAVRNMLKNTDHFFAGAKPTSVRSIVTNIARETGREYQTATEDGGVRVWRHK